MPKQAAVKQLSDTQRAEVLRLKMYFPFRICYGALKGTEFVTGAVVTKRRPMRFARAGWHVEIASA